MADWTGDGIAVSATYRQMAEVEVRGVSPTYEALCLAVAGSPEVCRLLEGLPSIKRQPNLLLAAVRYLDGPVTDPAAFLGFVVEEWPTLSATMLQRRTQTNEPRRCAVLLPVLAALPQPLALIEVGASAGLCLYPDRYAYLYETPDGSTVQLGDSDVVLPCRLTGAVPLPTALPRIAWRAGLDLNPLHPEDPDDRRWLQCLIWPEQTDRIDRLDKAAAVAVADPPRIDVGDLLTDLPALVADAPADATVVVFHSAVLAYLGERDRVAFVDVIAGLRQQRTVEWVSNEAPGVVPDATVERDGSGRFLLARNQNPLALTGPHGHSVDWL